METHWQSASLIQHPISASPAGQQPHLAEIRRWRRQSVQMGRQICICLSSSNPVDRYNLADRPFPRSRELFRTDRGRPCPREWEDPQAKRCGGMERSGSLCGRVAAPLETLHGRECGSIGKLLLAGGTDADWPGRRGRPWKAGIATSAGKESNLPEGSSFGKRLPKGGTIGKQLPAGGTIGKQQMLTAALTGRIS